MNKTLKVMTSAALLAGVVAPVAVTTVDAASKNIVDKVLYVDDEYTANGENNLYIENDKVALTTDDTFRLTLPQGVKWDTAFYTGDIGEFTVVSVTDQDLELKVDSTYTAKATPNGNVPLHFEVDGAEGDIKVTLDPRGSKLTGGQYTIAVVAAGATKATIPSVTTIGSSSTQIKDIRIDETAIGAISAGEVITLTLPSKFKWDLAGADVQLTGGLSTVADPAITPGDRKISFTVAAKSTGSPGTIYIKGLKIDAEKGAQYGDVEVSISGSDKVTDEDLVVAKYADYSTTIEVDDVPTLLAGRSNSEDVDDLKLAKVTFKEDVAGTWVNGREVNVEFPEWVKVVGLKTTKVKGFDAYATDSALGTALAASIESDSNEFEFNMPAAKVAAGVTEKREFTVEFYVSVQADQAGDVEAVITGKAGVEGEAVLGKVVAPVTVATTPANVKTGMKNQKLSDIVITESQKGAFIEKGEVKLSLGDDVEFSKEPKVTVTEGNLEIEKVDVKDGVLTFSIKSASTKASKIAITDVEATLDRTIPEGDVKVSVGGSALVKNDEGDKFEEAKIGDADWNEAADVDTEIDVNDFGTFEKDNVGKFVVATVVTPADGNVSAETVTLTIGQGTMKVGDKEVALDAAPYIEASTGRTYLPLRAIANAVGASSVEWDNAARTATVIKGGLVAQMTIGQNAYVLNGAKIGMDGKAQINKERTFLPVRALGNALGADVQWDAATQTITIK